MFKLFRAGECRCAHKSLMGQRLRISFGVKSLGQTEIDYFHQQFFRVYDAGTRESLGKSVLGPGLCAALRHFGFAIGLDEHQVCGL